MRTPKPAQRPPVVRVIRDPRDGRRDFFLPRPEAFALYQRGVLSYDLVNQCYCTKEKA